MSHEPPGIPEGEESEERNSNDADATKLHPESKGAEVDSKGAETESKGADSNLDSKGAVRKDDVLQSKGADSNLDSKGERRREDVAQPDASLEALLAHHRAAVQEVLLKHCELAAETITQITMGFHKRATGQSVQADDETNLSMPEGSVMSDAGPTRALQQFLLNGPLDTGSRNTTLSAPLGSRCGAASESSSKGSGFPERPSIAPRTAMSFPKKSPITNEPHDRVRTKTVRAKATLVYPAMAEMKEKGSTELDVHAATTSEAMLAAQASVRSASREVTLAAQASVSATKHPKKLRKAARGVFVDVETIKQKLRLEMAKNPYNVADLYHESGFFQAVATSVAFDSLTLIVIALNALWIAVDADLNDAPMLVDAKPEFQIVDNLFCAYFATEWFVRFMSFRRKREGFTDAWFVFDTFMCALMAFETWLMTLAFLMFGSVHSEKMGDASLLKGFRLVRLIRMARIMRLLKALPELMVVIKGMAVATRAVSCTVMLMILIVYVFAILFRQLSDGTPLGGKYFTSVLSTMRFLFLNGTIPDLAEVVLDVWDENVLYAAIFLFFILIITITVMNMLVGVLVGVVSAVADVEKEQLTVNFVKENLQYILHSVRGEGSVDDVITKEDFALLLQRHDSVHAFDLMGVDVFGLLDLTDFIFKDTNMLDFAEFMDLILQLRGTNQATVKDIVDLRKFIVKELKSSGGGGLQDFAKTEEERSIDACSFRGSVDYGESEHSNKFGKTVYNVDTACEITGGQSQASLGTAAPRARKKRNTLMGGLFKRFGTQSFKKKKKFAKKCFSTF